MGVQGEFDEVLAEVARIEAAAAYCRANPHDHQAPLVVERLAWAALADGCPARVMVDVLVRAFTGLAGLAALPVF
jgi:hypothetical protein